MKISPISEVQSSGHRSPKRVLDVAPSRRAQMGHFSRVPGRARGAGAAAPGSTIYTDGLKSFSGLLEAGFKHVARSQPLRSELRKGAKSAVPLADRAIGNLQQWLIGTYHGVSKDQLQVYLDEFVFRHNRRKTPAAAFQTLLGLGTGRTSTGYEQIRGVRDLNPNLLWLAEATNNQKLTS
jgi:transposase-like protein